MLDLFHHYLVGCLYYLYQWCTVKERSNKQIASHLVEKVVIETNSDTWEIKHSAETNDTFSLCLYCISLCFVHRLYQANTEISSVSRKNQFDVKYLEAVRGYLCCVHFLLTIACYRCRHPPTRKKADVFPSIFFCHLVRTWSLICIYQAQINSQFFSKRVMDRVNILSVNVGVIYAMMYRVTQKHENFWKTQQKLKKPKKKKFIDRNWTITTCLLRDSNPDY